MGDKYGQLVGDFTQVYFEELLAKLIDLEIRAYLGEDIKKNRSRIKEMKDTLDKEIGW